MIAKGNDNTKWKVKVNLIIQPGETIWGVFWDITPTQIRVWGTPLPPFYLSVTQTRV